MITVRCTYGNGDIVVTRINATLDEARAYFLGNWFNIGSGPEDNMQQCVKVERIDGPAEGPSVAG